MNFNGYKTYILALVAVVYAVSGYFTGHFDSQTMLDMVWAALTAAAIRHGISNDTNQ